MAVMLIVACKRLVRAESRCLFTDFVAAVNLSNDMRSVPALKSSAYDLPLMGEEWRLDGDSILPSGNRHNFWHRNYNIL